MKSNGKTNIENNKPNRSNAIVIKGAKVNNLKNIDVEIPHNKLVVVTGLSGSGKSSLVFDTIYAEGQRRYIESLSSYARQFLERIDKPDVDSITGLAPSMAIEIKSAARNPRSTVGTSTEIYDYLRLLFARAGKTYSPVSGKEVTRNTIEDILKFLSGLDSHNGDGSKLYITFPLQPHKSKTSKQELDTLKQKGFFRIYEENEIIDLNQKIEPKNIKLANAKVIVDRLIYKHDDNETLQRVTDSLEQA